MLRVVLDTNILVSGIGWPGFPGRLVDKWIDGKFTLVESPTLLGEFRRVIKDEKFAFLDQDDIDEFFRMLVGKSEVVEPASGIDVVKEDPADNRVLECAIAGRADLIVSGDRHLLRLGSFAGVRIVTARQMMNLMPKD
jgi:putative PIN family toxin of toxin-antitoxin system